MGNHQWRIGNEIEPGMVRRRVGQEVHQNAAGVIDQIAKTLRHQNSVPVAGRGMLDLIEIIVGQRFFEGDLYGSGRLVFVPDGTDRHKDYTYTLTTRRSARGDATQ